MYAIEEMNATKTRDKSIHVDFHILMASLMAKTKYFNALA